jgi:hypothetical protein
VVHTWSSTQAEGWLRIGMDEYKIPYDYVSVHAIRDTPDLKSRWDVLVMGPSSGDALSLLRGVQGTRPQPWQKTEVTPNLGRQDSTADMRGGIELSGLVNLARFLEDGGVFVTVGNTSAFPAHFGLAQGVSIRTTSELWAPGGVFRTRIADAGSPLAYGYGEELGVYFNRGPVFAGGGAAGGFGGGGGAGAVAGLRPSTDGSTTARRTGRGDVSEPDIVQGRPRDMGRAGVQAFQAEQRGRQGEARTPGGPEAGPGGPGAAGAAGANTRVVARFPAQPTDLLISGGLVAGAEMASAPALVDARYGDGHVVMFSFNPFWRGETLGGYGLLFNALMHHQHLDAGR